MTIVTAATIVAPLRANPMSFLRNNLITFYSPDGVGVGEWTRDNHNAVVPPQRMPQQGHRPLRFCVNHVEELRVQYPGRLWGWWDDGNCYQIRIDQNGDEIAYFLPWQVDSGYSVVLEQDAELFFNAQMNGCSFGWTVGPNGIIRVAHHNIQNDRGTDNDAMVESLAIYDNRFVRNDYRNRHNGTGEATIVGVRNGNAWGIFVQYIYRDNSGPYRIEEVQQLE